MLRRMVAHIQQHVEAQHAAASSQQPPGANSSAERAQRGGRLQYK
jgi:hypothetical protein